jgi:hypothetical protein
MYIVNFTQYNSIMHKYYIGINLIQCLQHLFFFAYNKTVMQAHLSNTVLICLKMNENRDL